MTKKPNLVKNILTHLAAIIIFLGISTAYFSPLLENKILPKGDITQYQGASQELREYYKEKGKSSTWTNSMFSGMPSYQIGVWGDSNILSSVEKPLRALGDEVGPVFTAMLMAYILFLCIGLSPFGAILGAIAYSLGSYNIIIIAAGHITKAWAIAYMPLIIAGMLVLLRRKYILGGVLLALGLALQIKSNHLQISYYLAILCAFISVALIVELIQKKQFKDIAKLSAILAIAISIGLLSNITNIYTNYEMGQESTRGKSELKSDGNKSESSGLSKDYAFAWSYGKMETLSILIPNIHGGASSGMLDKNSHLYKELRDKGQAQMLSPKGVRSATYWGEQMFTAGPVYFGAIICFLFILGMLVISHRLKWYLLGASIFFVLLSWGRNFDAFNTFFFNYMPFYNKFRTVSMALVIPAATMLIIAIWGLKELFSSTTSKEEALKSLYISAGFSAGICLLFWLIPDSFFNFSSSFDKVRLEGMPDWYINALLADRKEMLSSDALRSFIYIALAAIVLFFGIRTSEANKNWITYSFIALAVLVFADLWMVDKRYLNEDSFIAKQDYMLSSFPLNPVDKAILSDKSASYRVLNLDDPFQDAHTSYYHKSIGGYHAAKLMRYQELIDYHLDAEVKYVGGITNKYLAPEITKLNAKIQAGQPANPADIAIAIQDSTAKHLSMLSAVNMLNAKYIIYHPELPPIENKSALGNAWFVQSYQLMDNAKDEIDALADYDLQHTAIIDKRFENELRNLSLSIDSTAFIVLNESKPNLLKYATKTNKEQLAVFSEIYYPHGWQAYIDGEAVNHFRANWTLRAMRIPAGQHELVFKFEPKGYNSSVIIANISSTLLILLAIGSLAYYCLRKRRKEKEN